MMPSAKHGDPQLGIDVHLCIVPPSPSPVPLPTPHLSVVFDPFDYVPVIGATVSVFGMKRATAGTGAIVVHIPPGFPFAPMLPDKDDELFMGSATVVADGDPLSYLALPVLGCQVAGMPSPPRPKKKRIPMPTLLPTTFNLAIPTSVRVGGPPTISMMGLAFKGAFAGLGKLGKSKFGKALGDRFKKFRQKLFKNMDPGFLKCKVLRAEPVNILTGEVVVEQVDFTLQGCIPIEWRRCYRSGSRRRGHCGIGWETPADARLEFDPQDGTVLFQHPSEGPALFSRQPAAQGDEAAVLEAMDGARLSQHGSEFRVRTKAGLTYHFPSAATHQGEDGVLDRALGRITDACGNWVSFDRSGRQLSAIRDSSGQRIAVERHDGCIRRLLLSVPDTGVTHLLVDYEYDRGGDLAAVRDALGHPYRFAYDNSHMVRHTDRTGLSFYYEYDKVGPAWRVVHAWGDGGLYDYRFEYWSQIRETRIIDSLGHLTVVQCDERGLPILEIDALGGRTIFEYDEAGRTIAIVDAANHRSAFLFDERGNLLKWTRADGSVLACEFDEKDRPTRLLDPLGGVWCHRWDDRGLLREQQNPLGTVTRYEYSDTGFLASVGDGHAPRQRFTFNGHGHLLSQTDAAGAVTRFECDALGNVVKRTDPLGRTTRYSYDPKGRLLDVRLPGGAQIGCEYDAEDRLVRYAGENGEQVHLDYCGLGLIKRRRLQDGSCIEYHYDTEERLAGVTNPRGETWQFRRDAAGRVIEEIDYWGQSTRYRFDAAGHLRQCQDALGRIVTFDTDPLGRIRRKLVPPVAPGDAAQEETFEFDAAGQLVRCANAHVEVVRSYDALGRLIEEKQGQFVVRNHYDEAGNRVRREAGAGLSVAFGYDACGRVASIRAGDTAAALIERDAAGQPVRETLAEGLVRQFRYDREGRVTACGLARGKELLFSSRYGYDVVGRLVQRTDSQYGVDRFAYDPLGQITQHIDPFGKLSRCLNDPAGDRLIPRATQELPGAGDPLAAGAQDWLRQGTYDGLHCGHDRAGNLVFREDRRPGTPAAGPQGPARFEWDPHQRLVRSQSGGVTTRYIYDPLGRRIGKESGGRRSLFYWDGDVLLAEEQVPAAGAPARAVLREYLHYPGTFVPFALIEHTTDAARVFFYQNDPNGCPTRLVSPAGRTVWAARYGPWGAVEALMVNEVVNPLRLQGQYEDIETGLHYNRHRYYDPAIGSFVSKDPIGLAGGENPYRYGPNVFGWTDPLGLTCEIVGGKYEYYYRAMSRADFDHFLSTGRLRATTETFVSPTRKFSEAYEGVLVKFQLAEGTTQSLRDIGVRAHGKKSEDLLPDLPQVKKRWTKSKALFKPEGDQINVGLGKGRALDVFNDGIRGFEILGVNR